jgi:hypothetical protein
VKVHEVTVTGSPEISEPNTLLSREGRLPTECLVAFISRGVSQMKTAFA